MRVGRGTWLGLSRWVTSINDQEITTPLSPPLLTVPPIFQEDELYFELFCDYCTKTCDYPLHKLHLARRRRRKNCNYTPKTSGNSDYFSNYHDNSNKNKLCVNNSSLMPKISFGDPTIPPCFREDFTRFGQKGGQWGWYLLIGCSRENIQVLVHPKSDADFSAK